MPVSSKRIRRTFFFCPVAPTPRNRPSFWGHPYTCDGAQVPGLPALCAPQQTLMTVVDGEPDPFGEWIDTVELFEVVDP